MTLQIFLQLQNLLKPFVLLTVQFLTFIFKIQIIFESKYLKNFDFWIQILKVRTLHPLCQSTHSNFSILTVLGLQKVSDFSPHAIFVIS